MLKKTIKYKDFNDEEVEEDFYFHLSKAELVELEMSHDGGMQASLQRIINSKDSASIIKEFKNIILSAYGIRSADGRRFTKNQALRDEFESTEAYSTLFMELVTNTDAAVEFVNGIIPSGLSEDAARAAGIDPKVTPLIAVESDKEPEKEPEEIQIVTKAEVNQMSNEDMQKLGERLAKGEVRLTE